VLAGLRAEPMTLPCKYLYDERGSQLFELICGLDEYYLTRADLEATERHIDHISAQLGRGVRLVELGSGSSTKTRVLLDHLPDVASYIPVDISADALADSAERLRVGYPDLEVLPVLADYTAALTLPVGTRPAERTVVYFPGSTIGNFHPPLAIAFLRRIAAICRRSEQAPHDGGLLIGVDLAKSAAVLEAAYDDALGVTAAFNLNLLSRINAELEADFDLRHWQHRARYDEQLKRIEMHLVSCTKQEVHIGDESISFAAGQTIRSEESYKYSLDDFHRLAAEAGLDVKAVWTDEQERFSLQWLTPRAS
jgi:dimethylhistidine N-methyltransferase